MKECSRCNISKDESEFYKDKSAHDGLTSSCKKCQKEYQRKRYKENKDEIYNYTPVEPKKVECRYCGDTFESKYNPKYCSDKCKWKSARERNGDYTYTITCKGCGEEAEVTSKDVRYCSHECYYEHGDHSNKGSTDNYNYDRECETCGDIFNSGCPSAKYCSDECKPDKKYYKRCSVYFKTCEYCGENYTTRIENSKSCSQSCSSKLYYYEQRDKVKEVTKECLECGEEFVVQYFNSPRAQKYCSHSCFRRKRKRDRKYRKRNNGLYEEINRTRVFEDDNWKCQQCGCDTPKELMGEGLDNSPTLDHVIPLAKGGNHTYRNVQLLCRMCNTMKSDEYEGQLELV